LDLGIVIGLVAGIALIFAGIAASGGSLMSFVDTGSVLIVVGGTIASAFIHFKPDQMIGVPRLLRVALSKARETPRSAINLLVGLAEKARREGLLAMEDEAEKIDDAFLRKGIRLVVDGTDPETVRQILDIELTFLEERHRAGQHIFEYMGAVAPAFGMVGTLIGLIIMLGSLNNPDAVGPAMAVALITTFYGVILAHLVFNPIAGKLRVRSEEEVLLREVMIEGILSIQAGENPHIVRQKLESFLSPAIRRELEEQSEVKEAPVERERVAATGVR